MAVKTAGRNKANQQKYINPPYLSGYTFSPSEARQARDEGRLLSMRIETNRLCNLNCRYCYAESGESIESADIEKLKNLITDGAKLGLKSVVVIGGGEPTLYKHFRELISFIDTLGIIPVVFTNTILIDRELAEFLYAHKASVMGKLDSLEPKTQDFLTGKPGSLTAIKKGLRNLMLQGFTEPDEEGGLRLGVSFVANRLNAGEIEDIWFFCRENNIFPNMELLTPAGRGSDFEEFILNQDEIKKFKEKLLNIDRRYYSFNWIPYTPLAASGCLQHFYSMYINIDGNVRPCARVKFDENRYFYKDGIYPYNINRKNLSEVYDSELFKSVRNIDSQLEGKCSDCEYSFECIGCRGFAYSVGVNNGINPLKALKMECRQCFK